MPTYLNCPYCPAQAYPSITDRLFEKLCVETYRCPAKHWFLIQKQIAIPQVVTALDTKEAHDVQTER